MLYPVKRKTWKVFAAAVLAVSLIFVNGLFAQANGSGAVTGQMREMEASAYAGTGSSEDPYRIAVAGDVDGKTTPFTAPSAFWDGNTGNGVSDKAVVFERREGNITDGKLISSMEFDMGKNKTEVWDGKNWPMAFRFAPWTAFDSSDGNLKIGFAYKGDFSVYYTDWKFKFDVQSLTSGLDEDKQILPGDVVSLTYIGAYDPSQTSRGTNYKIDFSDTDSDVELKVQAVVDAEGYVTFSGANKLIYGGNYVLEKVEVPVSEIIVSGDSNNTITEKNGSLQMKAEVLPENAADKAVKWSIADGEDKAVIDENGLLKALKDGDVTVRAAAVSNPEIYGECVVHISGQNETVPDNSDEDNENDQIKDENNQDNDKESVQEESGKSDTSDDQNITVEKENDIPETADSTGVAAVFFAALVSGTGILVLKTRKTMN